MKILAPAAANPSGRTRSTTPRAVRGWRAGMGASGAWPKPARWLGLLALAAGLWPTPLLAQSRTAAPVASPAGAPAPSMLVGFWQGPLPIPGGTLPIELSIAQSSIGPLTASLNLPAKRVDRVPVSITFRGDTVVFYAPAVAGRFAGVLRAEGQELRGTWTQPGLRVPLLLHHATIGGAAGAAGGPANAAAITWYHTEPVSLTSPVDNLPLAGSLSVPEGPGPFPAVLLLADMGGFDRDESRGNYRLFAGIAATLARQGIAVLRLDDRGTGESPGNHNQLTTADRVRDAQAGLGLLRARPTIDPARLGLIGHGEGGNVALLAAAQPLPPGFVVALAAAGMPGMELLAQQAEPVASPADTAATAAARRQAWAEVLQKAGKLRASGSNPAQVDSYLTQQQLKLKSEVRKQAEATLKFRRSMLEIVRQTADHDQAQAIVQNMLRQHYPEQDAQLTRSRATQLTAPWLRYYLAFDPRATLTKVSCPVLLLQGTEDAEVNAVANLPLLEKGLQGNKRVTVRRLPGTDHWFQLPASSPPRTTDGNPAAVITPELLETVRDWVLLQAGT